MSLHFPTFLNRMYIALLYCFVREPNIWDHEPGLLQHHVLHLPAQQPVVNLEEYLIIV